MKKKVLSLAKWTIIYLLFFLFSFLGKTDMDLMWNYGFSYNVSMGLQMYTDFKMVIGPLYPWLMGIGLKLLSSSMLSFYLLNAFIPTITLYLISKLDNKVWYMLFIFILCLSFPNYNNLCILFFFLLLFLEKKEANDYLIGIIIGLSFLTKNSIAFFLCLPTIYYLKQPKKIFKRLLGFFLPVGICFIILMYQGSILAMIDQTILGLFSFANQNGNLNLYIISITLIIIYFTWKFFKERNIEYLYIIFFQGINFPLFNTQHFLWSILPVIFYIFKKFNYLLELKWFRILCKSFCFIPFLGIIFFLNTVSVTHDDNLFKVRFIEETKLDLMKELDKLVSNNSKQVIYCIEEAYLYKLIKGQEINNFDLINSGNLGYNGEIKYLDNLKKLPKKTKIVINSSLQNQVSPIIYQGIKDNFNLKATTPHFWLYEIT